MKKLLGLLFFCLMILMCPKPADAQEVYTYIHPYTGVRTKCMMDYRTDRCITLSPDYSDEYSNRNYRRSRDGRYSDGYRGDKHARKRYLEKVYDRERNEEYYRERRSRVRQRIDYGLNGDYYRRGLWFRHTIWLDGEKIDIVSSSRDFRPTVYRDNGGFYYYDY